MCVIIRMLGIYNMARAQDKVVNYECKYYLNSLINLNSRWKEQSMNL